MMFPHSANMTTLFSLAKFSWLVVTVLTGFCCIKKKMGILRKFLEYIVLVKFP